MLRVKDNISAFNSTEYDEKIKHTLPFYGELYKQVVDVVKIHNPQILTWHDVGCGTGKMEETALGQLDVEQFVFCDSSAEMIGIVQKRFDVLNVSFLISDIQKLRYSSQFDVVTAIQVNHYFHIEDRIKAIQNCYRALKPGGIFITFENFAPYSDFGKQLYLDRWKAYQLSQGKSPAECDNHISRYGNDYLPISISEHLEVMNNCGFKAVEFLWLSYMQIGPLGIK